MACTGTVFIVTVVGVLEVRLWTEIGCPPRVHLHGCLLAGDGVEVEAVTEGLVVTTVVANVINAFLKEATRGHNGMTLLEGAFRITDQATEHVALKLLYLGEITVWTVVLVFAIINTARGLCHPPALSHFLRGGSLAAILHHQIIFGVHVVVSAQATHSASVAARDFDKNCSAPVIGNHEPKFSFDLCRVTH